MASGLLRNLVAVALLLSVCGCSPARTVEAARLLSDIARQDSAGAVQRVAVTYRGAQGTRRAHLYVPAESRAGLVLVPGAAERVVEDPRLIGFADALRRRGFRVLVPELGGSDFLQVSAADADAIADAARWLLASGEASQVGMAALSYAVGPTLQAALRPDLRERTGFVVAIGGYHSVLAGITYLTTGAFREGPDGPWRRTEVDRRAKWIFLQANTEWIDDPNDARLLEAIARARLAGAETGSLAARLGPEGRAVYRVFANRDPARVPALISDLPPRIRAEIGALDLAALDLRRLGAALILIHGLDDPLVPHTESLKLARAAGEDRSDVFLLRNLQHVDLAAPGPADLAALLGAAYRVLEERDRIAAQRHAGPASN
jgi:hypothetical protein